MRIGDSLGRSPGDEQSPVTTSIERCRPPAASTALVAVRDEPDVPDRSGAAPVRKRRRALLTMALFVGAWALLVAFAGSANAVGDPAAPRTAPTSDGQTVSTSDAPAPAEETEEPPASSDEDDDGPDPRRAACVPSPQNQPLAHACWGECLRRVRPCRPSPDRCAGRAEVG